MNKHGWAPIKLYVRPLKLQLQQFPCVMKKHFCFDFFQPQKSVKTILRFQALQKQVAGQTGALAIVCQLLIQSILVCEFIPIYPVLALVNNSAMKILVQISWWALPSVQGVDLLGHSTDICLNLVGAAKWFLNSLYVLLLQWVRFGWFRCNTNFLF